MSTAHKDSEKLEQVEAQKAAESETPEQAETAEAIAAGVEEAKSDEPTRTDLLNQAQLSLSQASDEEKAEFERKQKGLTIGGPVGGVLGGQPGAWCNNCGAVVVEGKRPSLCPHKKDGQCPISE